MSLTIQGWVAGLLSALFAWADVPVASEAVEGFIQVVLGLYAVFGVYYGRYRKGDIYLWGGRK